MPGEFSISQYGSLKDWGLLESAGGPQGVVKGRHMLEKDVPLEFFGISLNYREPGQGPDFWHAHSVLEELYLFLEGEGEMALDDKVVPVRAGTAVRVGQGVMRSWRAHPNSPTALKCVVIRGGGAKLKDIGRDAELSRERPLPW